MKPATSWQPAMRSDLQRLYAPVAQQLEDVELILRRELSSRHSFVDELVRYGRLLGGKRLRPALLLLTGQAVGTVTEHHVLLAAVVEMIHTATLIHDDVLDMAQTRRHLATVNARWDNQASILLGDFLFSNAFYLASTTGSTRACQLIGRATNVVCEGEIRQKGTCGDFRLSEEDYLEIVSAKTAELCACSCELGARFAGADEEGCERLGGYGRELGIAFQIIDDVLDLQGEEHDTGKSLGTDLAQRIPTLPLIYLLRRMGEDEQQSLLAHLQDPAEDASSFVLPLLHQYGAIEYALGQARVFADRARRAVADLPDSPAACVLRQLPDFVVERSS